jgi:hypothetical protein
MCPELVLQTLGCWCARSRLFRHSVLVVASSSIFLASVAVACLCLLHAFSCLHVLLHVCVLRCCVQLLCRVCVFLHMLLPRAPPLHVSYSRLWMLFVSFGVLLHPSCVRTRCCCVRSACGCSDCSRRVCVCSCTFCVLTPAAAARVVLPSRLVPALLSCVRLLLCASSAFRCVVLVVSPPVLCSAHACC